MKLKRLKAFIRNYFKRTLASFENNKRANISNQYGVRRQIVCSSKRQRRREIGTIDTRWIHRWHGNVRFAVHPPEVVILVVMEANSAPVERVGSAGAVVVLDRVHVRHLKRTVVVEQWLSSAVDRWRRRRHVVSLARGAAYRSKACAKRRSNREDKQLSVVGTLQQRQR